MDELEVIKSKIDIVELIQSFIPVKKAGRNWQALCPFHGEKTPSFMVSPERQIFKCFGCGEGGDIFKFYMKMENLDFAEALKELAERAGVKLTSYQPSDTEKQKKRWWEINHLAGEFFHYLLTNHRVGKKALEYILGRGISKGSLEKFSVGFAPESWNMLFEYLNKRKGYRAEEIEKVGLVFRSSRPGKDNYLDRFRGRLMFPLKDQRGNVCGFAGRIVPGITGNNPDAKYVNTPETEIYHKSELLYGFFENKQAIKQAQKAILVEGELDLISSTQAGVDNVTAIKGSALTLAQAKILARVTPNLVLALDADSAGGQAAKRAIEVGEQAGLNLGVVMVSGGKDPDEVAQKDPEGWKKQVGRPVAIYDFLIDLAIQKYGLETANGKKLIGQEVLPVLNKIEDEIVQAHYVKLLAEKLEVNEEQIRGQMQKSVSAMQPAKENNQPTTQIKKRREIVEEYLLAIAVQEKKWRRLTGIKVKRLIKTSRWQRILEVINDLAGDSQTKLTSKQIEERLPEELKESFNLLFLRPLEILDEDQQKKEWQTGIRELEKLELGEKLDLITQEIKREEKGLGRETELTGLTKKFQQLSEQLSDLKKE